MKTITKYIWVYLYIAYVAAYLFAFSQLKDISNVEKSAVISLLPLAVVVLGVLFEFLLPYNKKFNEITLQTLNNVVFFFISNYADILGKTIALFLIPHIIESISISNFSVWPASIPVVFQVIIAILLYDFVYYWYHRLSHKTPFLWRFHRLHHSTTQLNLLALGRFNFFDLMIEILILTLVIHLSGMPLKVFYIMEGFMIPATFLSHANIKSNLPKALNWLIITPSTHRIHHAKSSELHDKNFGGFTLFWDIVFDTYEPGYNIENYELGIENHETSKWIWFQFFDFLKK